MRRSEHLARLQSDRFDLLVIGGGASGAGVALDAASRGLKVALVERDDFASGTSSRSTKLVHGGVRYLEAAITQLDRAQFHLVREALAERATLLAIAPHLVHPLRTVVPAYRWLDVLFYRVGMWLYDRAAGDAAIAPSRFIGRRAMLDSFPRLRRHRLKGGVAYFDGQFDDARMAITLLLTAARESAVVVNRVAVTGLNECDGRLTGVRVRDAVNGQCFDVRAGTVVNATGPSSDAVRRMEDAQARTLLVPSRGTHLVLDPVWAPAADGLLVPKTSDGRVLFLLPWEGRVVAGTTDIKAQACADPKPEADEIDYLLDQLDEWLHPSPGRAEVRASWAGLRPLIAMQADNTASIVREHHIEVGPKGLVTIAGGKWTTYRLMAEETVDRVLQLTDLDACHPCRTRELTLVGADGFHPQLAAELAAEFHLDESMATHLARGYGGLARRLLETGGANGTRRLATGHPYIEAEVTWARDAEMALTAEDVLARRTRLAFVDHAAALGARARVEALLAGGINP